MGMAKTSESETTAPVDYTVLARRYRSGTFDEVLLSLGRNAADLLVLTKQAPDALASLVAFADAFVRALNAASISFGSVRRNYGNRSPVRSVPSRRLLIN